jgi:hypothetical protein
LSARGGNGGFGGNKGNGTTCNYSATFCGSQNITSGNGQDGGQGGGGSGGRIKIFVPSCNPAVINPTHDVQGGSGSNPGQPGTFTVVCSVTGIQQTPEYHKFTVFPNPAKNEIKLKFVFPHTLKNQNSVLHINDINGKSIMEINNPFTDNDEIAIDISSLPNGIYFLGLQTEDGKSLNKFIKQ